jgi:tetratricopeptide (TPR) repeat protein
MSLLDLKYIEDKIRINEWDLAFKRIESSLKNNPTSAELLYYKSLCLTRFEKYDDAINILLETIKLDPNNTSKYNLAISVIYSKLGLLSFSSKKFNESLKSYNLALSYNNESSEANYGLGIIALESNDFNKALTYFKTSIKLNENNFYSIYKLGVTYFSLADFSNAKKNYLKAMSIQSSYIDVYFSLAQLYFQDNDSSLGLNTLRDAHMIQPNNISLNLIILSKMYELKLYDDLNKFLDANYVDLAFKPNYYYAYKLLLNKIDSKNFKVNYLMNSLDQVKIYDINPSDDSFRATVDKLATLDSFNIPDDLATPSSKGFNFGDKSIVKKYFLNFSDNYLKDINSDELYFNNISKDLNPSLNIIKSPQNTYLDEYSTHNSFLKGVFFFLDEYSPVKQNIDLNFSLKYINDGDVNGEAFKKSFVLNTYCFIVFPSFLKYKITSKSKFKLTYGYIEFNLST